MKQFRKLANMNCCGKTTLMKSVPKFQRFRNNEKDQNVCNSICIYLAIHI